MSWLLGSGDSGSGGLGVGVGVGIRDLSLWTLVYAWKGGRVAEYVWRVGLRALCVWEKPDLYIMMSGVDVGVCPV